MDKRVFIIYKFYSIYKINLYYQKLKIFKSNSTFLLYNNDSIIEHIDYIEKRPNYFSSCFKKNAA